MQMKREITITVVLAIVVVALVLGMKLANGSVEQADAGKFVLEDLHTRFPAAEKVEILSTEQKINEKGDTYYFIKARVSDGLAGPCPTRTHYYYNYPEQNFVPAPPEYVVKDCKVCEITPCVIAFEEEAIVASHTLPGTGAVQQYISASGAYPRVERKSGAWVVVWSSQLNYSYSVMIGDTGAVVSVDKI